MSIIPGYTKILHGGDWNPDQWRRYPDIIEADFDLMDKAHCEVFSLGIFSWGLLEPEEGVYDFSFFDTIMDKCARRGKKIFLATPGAARPAWMGERYPESKSMDKEGFRGNWVGRQGICYSSKVYRKRLAAIDGELAKHFAGHPALGGWHINNEFANQCFCPDCRAAFARFLEEKYGTLDNLNKCYWSEFWSHEFSSFSQVTPEDWACDIARLDWQRFITSQHIGIYRLELGAIRLYSDKPAATNMMGTFGNIDYFAISKECDFIGDDCYPTWYKGDVEREAARFAFLHDMHYTMQDKPFILFESYPGIPNYKPFVKMRRPNEFEREMLLALGHGADGTMYFQWRKGRGNCEKIHGAVVGHDGTGETLMFQRVAEYGRKLENISGIVDSKRDQQVAIIFDFESRWALDFTRAFSGDEGKKYEETVVNHYRALWKNNFDIAVIDSTFDFSRYKVLIAPMLYMLRKDVAGKLKKFVSDGGTLVMTYLSAYVDEYNSCFYGGNPGGTELKELFGIWSEDIDGFEPGVTQSIIWNGKKIQAVDFAEYIHAEGAEILAEYQEDFYAGSPAITCNTYGKGKAYYIGLRTDWEFLSSFYTEILSSVGIAPVWGKTPEELVVSRRISANGDSYYFVLNLTREKVEWQLPETAEDIWNGTGKTDRIILDPDASTILKVCKK